MNLQIDTRQNGDTVVLDLHGKITAEDASIREAIESLVARGAHDIILNFADVSYMDSIGLSTLVRAYLALRQQGSRLVLVRVPRQIAALFIATRLNAIFEMFETESMAIRSVTGVEPPLAGVADSHT